MGKPRSSWRLVVPGATLFFSSGSIVTLEVVASRLTARALGSSLYTWTFVAATVLGGLALGGWAGGRAADRFHPRRAIAVLLALASAACVALVIVNNELSEWTWLWRLSWPMHVFLHVALVFAVPSMLLGAVGPAVGKMALDQGLAPGRTLGAVFAWAGAGAIAGLVASGFFLIPNFGSMVVVWALGAALLAVALLYWISCWALYLWAMVFAALATMGMAPADWACEAGLATGLREPNDPGVLYEDETAYGYVSVHRVSQTPDRRVLRRNRRVVSEIVMSDPAHPLGFRAEVCAALVDAAHPPAGPLAALILAGDYPLAQYIEATRPGSRIDVVEIDPGVTAAARAAFGLPDDSAIRVIAAEPRQYLSRPAHAEDYAFIYADMAGDYAVSFATTTVQFHERVASRMADEGVYAIGLTDTRGSGRLIGAVVHTLEQTFPHVFVVGGGASPPGLPQTYVIVATRRHLDLPRVLTDHNEHWVFSVLDDSEVAPMQERCRAAVLTDDLAPVEAIQASVVRAAAPRQLAGRYLREAARLGTQGQYDRSVARYRQAAEQDPSLAMRAYNAIGLLCLERDDREGAAEAFERAIAGHIETGLQPASLAAVHVNLGVLLQDMGRRAEGRPHLAEAVRLYRLDLQRHPASLHTWDQLGETLVLTGRLAEAAEAFERAISLAPENLVYYDKLSKLLEVQKRYDEAIALARRQLDLLRRQDRRDAALELAQYIDYLEYQKAKQ